MKPIQNCSPEDLTWLADVFTQTAQQEKQMIEGGRTSELFDLMIQAVEARSEAEQEALITTKSPSLLRPRVR